MQDNLSSEKAHGPPTLAPHGAFFFSARALYTEDVHWTAPARSLAFTGREQVIQHLLREASGMHAPEFTVLRRFTAEKQIVEEYAVRFTYTGEGIQNAPITRGELVELKRVRIMELSDGRVARENCIETWTVLPRD